MDPRERIRLYEEAYRGEYDFESVMVGARQRIVIEMLTRIAPRIVVEVGCGSDLLFTHVIAAEIPVTRWVIVEPGAGFADAAQRTLNSDSRVTVVKGFFEEQEARIRDLLGGVADLVILSGILNEVESPDSLLATARALLAPSGWVHVNVPNARSLHRRLAVIMGLIPDVTTLTERNHRLHQYQVFDRASLCTLLEKNGFTPGEEGGYFLKPFTHAQMVAAQNVITPAVLAGLDQLGRDLPDLAAEIYVNAKLRG